jgi:hypothetical protein
MVRLCASRLAAGVVCWLALAGAGCDGLRPATRISDILQKPADYMGREVVIRGKVIDAWSLPFVEIRTYTVSDGSGSIVVRASSPTPAAGAAVTVRGRVENLAVLGGKPLGVHLVEVSRSSSS